MAHAFALNGAEHEVWLSRARDSYVLHVGDEATDVSLRPRGTHVHELLIGDVSHRIHIAVHGDDVHVHVDGQAHTLRYTHNLERFAGQAEDEAESVSRAPMPGAVISIAVAEGQAVKRGDVMMVIESMKMETAISASHDGHVHKLHVAPGQTFDRDAALITLSRDEAAPQAVGKP